MSSNVPKLNVLLDTVRLEWSPPLAQFILTAHNSLLQWVKFYIFINGMHEFYIILEQINYYWIVLFYLNTFTLCNHSNIGLKYLNNYYNVIEYLIIMCK